ncbi:MAG: hypothetical protein PHV87_04955 [Bacilli bacterium]|nr:hypothetical protein [Bacilli bacterium]
MFFEKNEYDLIYRFVMRNYERKLEDKDAIIDYLVTQCYCIKLHNDFLLDIISKIKSTLGIKEDDVTISVDDLPSIIENNK